MHGGETIDATIVDTNDANVQYNLKPNETVQYTAEVLVWENPDEEANYEEVLKSDISLTWALRGSLKLNQINLSMAGNEYLDGGDTDESPDTPS